MHLVTPLCHAYQLQINRQATADQLQINEGSFWHETFCLERSQECQNMALWAATGYVYLLLSIDIDIDFAAHAELREVNARFHGEASARQHTPLFACFQIIHVGPVAVSLLTDGVSGSMAEVLSIAGLFNDRTSSLINFPALKGFSATKRFLDAGDGRVAGLGDDL